MDDIFDEDADELVLISREYEKLSENIRNDGLRDGISQGQDSGLQRGFDSGYNEIFPAIESIYFLKGVMQAIYYRPEELSSQSIAVDDEGNKCLGELLKELRVIEKDVLRELGERQTLSQSTVDSFDQIKNQLLTVLEKMDLQIDDDELINCSLKTKHPSNGSATNGSSNGNSVDSTANRFFD
ncbi:protein YAE1 homolog [Panonychus citri]|uniref:protein YAE1 homolog n=1 Tax=Panonychus citri TaxID=50023 RepID=UPI002307F764|nr:protein YAE1 homolog [Panonychus citri]XP_053215005.1 protein YAE1 homolog [Panonychus citri]